MARPKAPGCRARRATAGAFITVLLAVPSLASTHGAYAGQADSPDNYVYAAGSFGCDYEATILATTGVTSHWRLGEPWGATAFDSKGTVNGVYTNGPTLAAAGAIAGSANGSVSLDGTNDHVAMGDVYDFSGTAPFSVEAWINRGSLNEGSHRRWIVDKYKPGGASGWALTIEPNSRPSPQRIAFERSGASSDLLTGTTATVAGRWYHVVATYDGATMRLYVNGKLESSMASSVSLANTANPFRLGSATTSNEWYDGRVDEVSVYNTALSATDVQDHWRCGRRYRDVVLGTSGLGSYWRLGETSGTTAFDSKGAYHGTYQNGVTLGAAGALNFPNPAASFDGVDDRVLVGDAYDFAGTAAFSVEAWINRGTVGAADKWRWTVTKHTVTAPREGWTIAIAPDSSTNPQRVFFERWSGGTLHDVYATTATVAGTWYHVVATYDGATMRIYVNGAQEGSRASTLSLPDTTHPVRIANSFAGTNHFDGRIDEVAVYTRALTAAEVAEHYASR